MTGSSGRPQLSLTDWTVLGLLAEAPRHGFAVAKELEPGAELGRLWTVRRPLVYRSLDHLVDLGLAEPRAVEPGEQGPHRTVLAATRSGRARLRHWIDEPVEHPRDVRATLLVKLALLARRGDPLTPLAQRQLDTFANVQAGLQRRGDPAPAVERLTIAWRRQANDAIRRFLEDVIRDEAETRPRGARTVSSRRATER